MYGRKSACTLLLGILFGTLVECNIPRKSHEQVEKIYEAVQRIEEQLRHESGMQVVYKMVKMDALIEDLGRKVDRLTVLFENGMPPSIGRSSSLMSRDLIMNLQGIDRRLDALEVIMNKVNHGFDESESSVQKLEAVEKIIVGLKTDFSQKLVKVMNIITALYEMNKGMKIAVEERSEMAESKNPGKKVESTESQIQASDFLVENLMELERKIQEGFSILGTDMRTEISDLRIIASNSKCSSQPEDEDYFARSLAFQRAGVNFSGKDVNKESNSRSSSRVEQALDTLEQKLGRSTLEIREEIHQGIQDIDHKLTKMSDDRLCGRLETSESVLRPTYVDTPKSTPEASQQGVAEREARKVEACSKMARNVSSPKSCAELRKGGATCDGVYVIFPQSTQAVRTLCDMTTDGGGWTVIMRRGDFGDLMTSFHVNWLSYKSGFGDREGEYWLGNDAIHLLTQQDDNVLRVNLEAFDGDHLNITYSSFHVANESQNYKLQLGPTVGPPTAASNSFRYHSNHPFSTFDKKNDPFDQNCASTYKGGWWFNGCYFGFLTGEYFKPGDKRQNWQGILWYDWKGNGSLKGAQMKIRPKNF